MQVLTIPYRFGVIAERATLSGLDFSLKVAGNMINTPALKASLTKWAGTSLSLKLASGGQLDVGDAAYLVKLVESKGDLEWLTTE